MSFRDFFYNTLTDMSQFRRQAMAERQHLKRMSQSGAIDIKAREAVVTLQAQIEALNRGVALMIPKLGCVIQAETKTAIEQAMKIQEPDFGIEPEEVATTLEEWLDQLQVATDVRVDVEEVALDVPDADADSTKYVVITMTDKVKAAKLRRELRARFGNGNISYGQGIRTQWVQVPLSEFDAIGMPFPEHVFNENDESTDEPQVGNGDTFESWMNMIADEADVVLRQADTVITVEGGTEYVKMRTYSTDDFGNLAKWLYGFMPATAFSTTGHGHITTFSVPYMRLLDAKKAPTWLLNEEPGREQFIVVREGALRLVLTKLNPNCTEEQINASMEALKK